MQKYEPISLPVDINTNEEEGTYHTGELYQHKNVVNHNTLVTAVDRVSYNDLSNITGQLVTAMVNSHKLASSVVNHCTEWLRKLRLKERFTPTFTYLPCIDSPDQNSVGK